MTSPERNPGKRSEPPLTLRWLPGRYAVCRLGPHEVIPPWAVNSKGFLCLTRTRDELSIVADADALPTAIKDVEHGWALLRVVGRLDFSLVGVLARLTDALAADEIPLMAVSTFDTDYLLVPEARRAAAELALKRVASFADPV